MLLLPVKCQKYIQFTINVQIQSESQRMCTNLTFIMVIFPTQQYRYRRMQTNQEEAHYDRKSIKSSWLKKWRKVAPSSFQISAFQIVVCTHSPSGDARQSIEIPPPKKKKKCGLKRKSALTESMKDDNPRPEVKYSKAFCIPTVQQNFQNHHKKALCDL